MEAVTTSIAEAGRKPVLPAPVTQAQVSEAEGSEKEAQKKTEDALSFFRLFRRGRLPHPHFFFCQGDGFFEDFQAFVYF